MEEISEKGTIQIIVCTVIHVILWHRNYLPIELKDCVFITHINTGTCTDSKTTCIFFSSLIKVCFMKITSALIKNLKASTCPWTQHICNAVWRFLSTALKFTPLISRYFMTYLKKKTPHLILLLPGTLSAILCMHDLRRNQYQMYLIRYAAMLLLKTNLYIG